MNIELHEGEYSDSDLDNLEQLYLKALRKKLLGEVKHTEPVPKTVEKTTPKLKPVKPSPKAKQPEYQNIQNIPTLTVEEKKTRGRPKKVVVEKVVETPKIVVVEKVVETPKIVVEPPTPARSVEAPKTLQNYNKEYYSQKKDEIAKKKLLKRIEKGENVSEKLLTKHGLCT